MDIDETYEKSEPQEQENELKLSFPRTKQNIIKLFLLPLILAIATIILLMMATKGKTRDGSNN